MFASLVTQSAPRGAIPLLAVTVEDFKKWEKKQTAFVRRWIKTQGFKPKAGAFLLLPSKEGKAAQLVACLSDPVQMWDLAALPKALGKGAYRLEGVRKAKDEESLTLGWLLGAYRFGRYKKGEETSATLCVSKKINIKTLIGMAETTALVRDLITTPAEDMGPAVLAQAIKDAGKAFKARVREIVGDDLLKKNYPAIHVVGRASPKSRAPRLVDLTWGNKKHPKVTLVGKGVCFDTGGLDIKTRGGMDLMRKDKAGGAIALGVAREIMRRKLPVRLRLLVPAVENAIDGNAFRPSDIITMRSGLTVEVGNTDAEGRLVLAEAMTEAATENPDLLIDFSTLCGGARSTMGTEISPFFSTDEGVTKDLLEAGEAQADPTCFLPLYKPYASALNSSFADMNSAPGTPYAQPIIAALFLQRFVPKVKRWVHFDFMGFCISSKPGRPEGGAEMSLRAVVAMLEKRYPRAR